MFGKMRFTGFMVAVFAVVAVTVIICVCAISCSSAKITFDTTYYYVCYRTTDNSVSASSLSSTASSYGGAGYILLYNGNYYVTVSCYYTAGDAQSVCDSLKRRDLDCTVLQTDLETFTLKSFNARRNSELYAGNLNTLHSLSQIAYECANGIDTGEITQSGAKEIITAIQSSLNGLLNANTDNCFTENLVYLIAECNDKQSGYILSKDLRYLQIAITDAIINAQLY